MKIGIVIGAMKPVTKGHWNLIQRAANENDVVKLFVSSGNRIRKGELPIYGKDAMEVWHRHLIPILPRNVEATFGASPLQDAWLELIELDGERDRLLEAINIYTDPVDAARFDDKRISKNLPWFAKNRLVNIVNVERSGEFNISGTAMRKFITSGNKKAFIQGLPPVSSKSADDIWNIYTKKIESLLKQYITLLIETS